jgi:hypothetical protein
MKTETGFRSRFFLGRTFHPDHLKKAGGVGACTQGKPDAISRCVGPNNKLRAQIILAKRGKRNIFPPTTPAEWYCVIAI